MNIPQLTIQGKGQPFIWLHGMLNSVESDSVYSHINLDQLSKTVSLVRYNFCDKSADGDYSWDDLTDELLNVADSLHLNQMILGGTSMGAAISLHAAVRFPERVKALVLVTPPPAWENRNSVKAVYQKIASKANNRFIPDFLRRLIQLNQDIPEFFEQESPGTRQRLIECRLGFDPQYYSLIYLGGAASDLPARHLIAQIGKPTLIVALPDDVNHPLEMAAELNSLIVNSKMVVVSNQNEYVNLQKTVRDFIDLVP